MGFGRKTVVVEQLSGNTWKLLRGVSCDGFRGPAGDVKDLRSVPSVTAWLIPSSGEYNAAAIVHDWLITDVLPSGALTSTEVDYIFREAMRALGVGFGRRWLMWAGVRWGAMFNPKRRAGSLK